MTVENFDIVVLGGGKGGKSLALSMSKAGKRVCLIESKMIGGSCINVACIPTKTMVAGTRLHYDARRNGFSKTGDSLKEVLARKRAVVSKMIDTHMALFTGTENLTFIKGYGRFIGNSEGGKQIEIAATDEISGAVEKRTVCAPVIFINTGTKPLKPDLPLSPGSENLEILDSTSIMELETLPESLVIIGGGYISLEFAQIFARLGSHVTILERGNQFLSREDRDIAKEVELILHGEGVDILYGVKVDAITAGEHGKKILELTIEKDSERESQIIVCDQILTATGRAAVNQGLNLEKIGVEVDGRGFIKVDEKLETRVPGVYALGDCKGGPFFTHASWDDYRIARDNLMQLYRGLEPKRSTKGRLIPYTLFVEPELGRVGLTEAEASNLGLDFKVFKLAAAKIPRAATEGETRGLLKAIVDKKDSKILGFAALCLSGGEIASTVQVAMLAGMTYDQLANVVLSHPTMCESLNLLFQES